MPAAGASSGTLQLPPGFAPQQVPAAPAAPAAPGGASPLFPGLPPAAVPPASGANPAAPSGRAASTDSTRQLNDWLRRLHEASRSRSYTGTFVVSSPGGGMSSSRIWHVCTGDQQFERIDSLTGSARTTLRHNDRVLTFLPESRVVRSELVESLRLFPNLLKGDELPLADLYQPRTLGTDRVAGFEADVVQLSPRDNLRFGLRVWSERRTGLVLKLQTLDSAGRVLEQASFSELQIDVPIKAHSMAQMMERTEGYRVQRSELIRTTAAAEGWALRDAVPGFKPMGCLKRPAAALAAALTGPSATGGDANDGSMQWIFSDGLATVSLFVEPFDARRHTQPVQAVSGATHMVSRRMTGPAQGWWLTAVGEVPLATLAVFAQSLERRAPTR